MTPTVDSVFDAELALPREDREALVTKLIESLENDEESEVSSAWKEEIRRRIEGYRRGEIKGIPAEEVMRSVRRRPNS
jgi:putative addiction module component (TIGR02574 family)